MSRKSASICLTRWLVAFLSAAATRGVGILPTSPTAPPPTREVGILPTRLSSTQSPITL